jgi:polar amino acid transport system ATP-binding protein
MWVANDLAPAGARRAAVTDTQAPVVAVRDLVKRFGPHTVLDGVSLEIARGQMVAIVGRSGSGKSTLLRCINALESIQGGTLTVCGHDLADAGKLAKRDLRRDVGIVFQSYNLFPHLTVERNITLALTTVKKLPKAQAIEIAHKVLALVGLEEKAQAYPEQLSGGQSQRVAIARSLALSPQLMLFDEVTSALDPELTGEVLKVMEDLKRQGMTMVLVTHEMAFARRVADIVVFMHQGRVWEMGPPEELFTRPRTAEFAQFTSSGL